MEHHGLFTDISNSFPGSGVLPNTNVKYHHHLPQIPPQPPPPPTPTNGQGGNPQLYHPHQQPQQHQQQPIIGYSQQVQQQPHQQQVHQGHHAETEPVGSGLYHDTAGLFDAASALCTNSSSSSSSSNSGNTYSSNSGNNVNNSKTIEFTSRKFETNTGDSITYNINNINTNIVNNISGGSLGPNGVQGLNPAQAAITGGSDLGLGNTQFSSTGGNAQISFNKEGESNPTIINISNNNHNIMAPPYPYPYQAKISGIGALNDLNSKFGTSHPGWTGNGSTAHNGTGEYAHENSVISNFEAKNPNKYHTTRTGYRYQQDYGQPNQQAQSTTAHYQHNYGLYHPEGAQATPIQQPNGHHGYEPYPHIVRSKYPVMEEVNRYGRSHQVHSASHSQSHHDLMYNERSRYSNNFPSGYIPPAPAGYFTAAQPNSKNVLNPNVDYFNSNYIKQVPPLNTHQSGGHYIPSRTAYSHQNPTIPGYHHHQNYAMNPSPAYDDPYRHRSRHHTIQHHYSADNHHSQQPYSNYPNPAANLAYPHNQKLSFSKSINDFYSPNIPTNAAHHYPNHLPNPTAPTVHHAPHFGIKYTSQTIVPPMTQPKPPSHHAPTSQPTQKSANNCFYDTPNPVIDMNHPLVDLEEQINSVKILKTSRESTHYDTNHALNYDCQQKYLMNRYMYSKTTSSSSSSTPTSTDGYVPNGAHINNSANLTNYGYSTMDEFVMGSRSFTLDENLKDKNLRDYLSSWNEMEEEEPATPSSNTDKKETNNNQPAHQNFESCKYLQQALDEQLPPLQGGVIVANIQNGAGNLPDILIDLEKTKDDPPKVGQETTEVGEKLYILETYDVPHSELNKYKHLSVINELPKNVVPIHDSADSLKFLEEIESNRDKYYQTELESEVVYDERKRDEEKKQDNSMPTIVLDDDEELETPNDEGTEKTDVEQPKAAEKSPIEQAVEQMNVDLPKESSQAKEDPPKQTDEDSFKVPHYIPKYRKRRYHSDGYDYPRFPKRARRSSIEDFLHCEVKHPKPKPPVVFNPKQLFSICVATLNSREYRRYAKADLARRKQLALESTSSKKETSKEADIDEISEESLEKPVEEVAEPPVQNEKSVSADYQQKENIEGLEAQAVRPLKSETPEVSNSQNKDNEDDAEEIIPMDSEAPVSNEIIEKNEENMNTSIKVDVFVSNENSDQEKKYIEDAVLDDVAKNVEESQTDEDTSMEDDVFVSQDSSEEQTESKAKFLIDDVEKTVEESSKTDDDTSMEDEVLVSKDSCEEETKTENKEEAVTDSVEESMEELPKTDEDTSTDNDVFVSEDIIEEEKKFKQDDVIEEVAEMAQEITNTKVDEHGSETLPKDSETLLIADAVALRQVDAETVDLSEKESEASTTADTATKEQFCEDQYAAAEEQSKAGDEEKIEVPTRDSEMDLEKSDHEEDCHETVIGSENLLKNDADQQSEGVTPTGEVEGEVFEQAEGVTSTDEVFEQAPEALGCERVSVIVDEVKEMETFSIESPAKQECGEVEEITSDEHIKEPSMVSEESSSLLESQHVPVIQKTESYESIVTDEPIAIFNPPSLRELTNAAYECYRVLYDYQRVPPLRMLCQEYIQANNMFLQPQSLQKLCEQFICSNRHLFIIEELRSEPPRLQELCQKVLNETNIIIDVNDFCIINDDVEHEKENGKVFIVEDDHGSIEDLLRESDDMDEDVIIVSDDVGDESEIFIGDYDENVQIVLENCQSASDSENDIYRKVEREIEKMMTTSSDEDDDANKRFDERMDEAELNSEFYSFVDGDDCIQYEEVVPVNKEAHRRESLISKLQGKYMIPKGRDLTCRLKLLRKYVYYQRFIKTRNHGMQSKRTFFCRKLNCLRRKIEAMRRSVSVSVIDDDSDSNSSSFSGMSSSSSRSRSRSSSTSSSSSSSYSSGTNSSESEEEEAATETETVERSSDHASEDSSSQSGSSSIGERLIETNNNQLDISTLIKPAKIESQQIAKEDDNSSSNSSDSRSRGFVRRTTTISPLIKKKKLSFEESLLNIEQMYKKNNQSPSQSSESPGNSNSSSPAPVRARILTQANCGPNVVVNVNNNREAPRKLIIPSYKIFNQELAIATPSENVGPSSRPSRQPIRRRNSSGGNSSSSSSNSSSSPRCHLANSTQRSSGLIRVNYPNKPLPWGKSASTTAVSPNGTKSATITRSPTTVPTGLNRRIPFVRLERIDYVEKLAEKYRQQHRQQAQFAKLRQRRKSTFS